MALYLFPYDHLNLVYNSSASTNGGKIVLVDEFAEGRTEQLNARKFVCREMSEFAELAIEYEEKIKVIKIKGYISERNANVLLNEFPRNSSCKSLVTKSATFENKAAINLFVNWLSSSFSPDSMITIIKKTEMSLSDAMVDDKITTLYLEKSLAPEAPVRASGNQPTSSSTVKGKAKLGSNLEILDSVEFQSACASAEVLYRSSKPENDAADGKIAPFDSVKVRGPLTIRLGHAIALTCKMFPTIRSVTLARFSSALNDNETLRGFLDEVLSVGNNRRSSDSNNQSFSIVLNQKTFPSISIDVPYQDNVNEETRMKLTEEINVRLIK
jgi:hypothetical protein